MSRSNFDFAALEEALGDECILALEKLGKRRGNGPFVAVALYGVYRETEGKLALPALGADEAVEDRKPQPFCSERWNPEDWSHPKVRLRVNPLRTWQRQLTAEATRRDEAHWRRTEARFFQLLIRVTRRLRDEAPDVLPVSDDFVAFWHDEEQAEAVAKKTIPKKLWSMLFTAPKRRNNPSTIRKASSQGGKQMSAAAAKLVACCEDDWEKAERDVARQGKAAVPALLELLDHQRWGRLAGRALGQIGDDSNEVIKALRKRASDGGWFARELAMLGDVEWLSKQAPPQVAVSGLSAPLLKTGQSKATRLDYGPLEALLGRGDRKLRKMAETEVRPGNSYCVVNKRDIPELLRGTGSSYAVIRWHAAISLADAPLNAKQAEQALDALAGLLGDRSETVRRLSLLAMLRLKKKWRALAKVHRPAVAKLLQDPEEQTRSRARDFCG